MEQFQISHLAKKNAHFLSGGEAQRVNLARAMIVEPEILFLDEPFSALDFPTKIKLMDDFKAIINSAETTTVFVSHDLMEINYLTNHLAIIVNGEVKQYGPTQRVLEHPNSATNELQTGKAAIPNEIAAALSSFSLGASAFFNHLLPETIK
jgi:tungstate transport system ATP-binding protein